MNSKFAHALWISLIILTGTFLRFDGLDKDPPESMELHFICDEGWWVHNARNQALFNEWVLDDFNQSLLASPTFCWSVFQTYQLFGVSLASSRFTSAFSGILCVLVFYLIMRKKTDHPIPLITSAFLSIGFGFVTLNRLALIDSTALLFALLTWLILEYASTRVWGVFLSGVLAGIAVITKSYVWALAPVLIALYLIRAIIDNSKWPRIIINSSLFSIGIATTYMFWHKSLYLGFEDQYRIMYYLWNDGNFPSSIKQFFQNMPSTFLRSDINGVFLPHFIALNTVLILLANWRISQLIPDRPASIRTVFRNVPRIDIECIVWILIVLVEILMLTAKPFRRYIFLYPPLLILAARSILVSPFPISISNRFLRFLRSAVCVVIPVWLLEVPIVAIAIKRFDQHGLLQTINPLHITLTMLLLSAMAAIALLFFSPLSMHSIRRLPIGAMLIAFGLFEGWMHFQYLAHPTYSMRDTSRRLGAGLLKENDYFLGGLAHTLSLENRAHPIAIWGREESGMVLNRNPVERFHPRIIVVLRSLDGNPWIEEDRYERYVSSERFIERLNLLPRADGSFRVSADVYHAPEQVGTK